MINYKKISADFQFIGSRVGQFKIETKDIQITESRAQITTDFDYNKRGKKIRRQHKKAELEKTKHANS